MITSFSFQVKSADGTVVQLSSHNEVFGKLLLISEARPINLQKVFTYPVGPIPWSLASSIGGLVKTNKSSLMHELEKGVLPLARVPNNHCSIIDGMALVRKLPVAGKTFDEFAEAFFVAARSLSKGAGRIDIVFDVYRDLSIKNAERTRRGASTLIFHQIFGNQPIKQWNRFLSNGRNKT